MIYIPPPSRVPPVSRFHIFGGFASDDDFLGSAWTEITEDALS